MTYEKIIPGPFILILHGPSCGGKSTLSDILFKRYGNIFKGKSDTLKRLISDYDPITHRDFVTALTLVTMKYALEQGFSVIKEGGLHGLNETVEFSKSMNIPLFIVNISAPWHVLAIRFEERIGKPIPGVKINTNTDRFKEIYEEYLSTKLETPLEFDSSELTPEEIVEKIVSAVRAY
jgi:broad-specificity NMP kinase